ncbi:kelch repeat-containing protein [Geobacter sp. DSM 9736]|uniref:kelch repeat-containing protein n=1 Tax=Geobacter sp. DSM 9736 TaxID=1277350 RepID=UPI000B508C0B|nr:kelch repeat-containing protein [Geobacter sp. DSM 9736]SNB45714.1 Kelch motif-containing protein [Geobacter sp. DSM 9736]
MAGCVRFVNRLHSCWFLVAILFLLFIPYPPPEASADGFSSAAPMGAARSYHTATILGTGNILICGGLGTGYLSSTELYDPVRNVFRPSPPLSTPRYYHSATLLPNGKVLIAGGSVNASEYFRSTELYDPSTNTISAAAEMADPRNAHTATLLSDGRVLIAGGYTGTATLSRAELYDPGTNSFSRTAGDMGSQRNAHTATLLPGGKILIAGGYVGSSAHRSTEVYDPATNTFTNLNQMNTARFYHTATLLPNGKVLIAGGANDTAVLSSAELFDPVTGTFTAVGSMSFARQFHSAVLLPNGKVLIAGGRYGNTFLNSAEIFDPDTNLFTNVPGMLAPRHAHTAALMANGKVMIAGGSNMTGAVRSTEVYNAATGSFSPLSAMTDPRTGHVSVLLPNGMILTAGGDGGSGAVNTAETFDPSTGSSTSTGIMGARRKALTATLLASGQILIAGGNDGSSSLSSAELYDPAARTFTHASAMHTPRQNHTATLLPDGKVLLAGGLNNGAPLREAELYDPATNSFAPAPSINTERHSHSAVLLPSGKVLISGGTNSSPLRSSELFDPATATFSPTGNMLDIRSEHSALLLPDGKVLVTGGTNGVAALSSAELYDPDTGFFSATGSLAAARHSHTSTLLNNGEVIVSGGINAGASVSSAETYSSVTNNFSPAPSMTSPRSSHTAVPLLDGRVYVAGGRSAAPLASAEVYDPGLGVSETRRPVISTVEPVPFKPNQLVISGTGFTGTTESSGGSTNNSSSDFPIFQLQRVEGGLTSIVTSDSTAPWSYNLFASAPFPPLQMGHYRASIRNSSIPSKEKIILLAPAVSAAPGSHDFSTVHVNHQSAPQPFTISNTGSADLSITTMQITGPDAAMFSATPEPGCRLSGIWGVEEACDVAVTFAPTSEGIKQATMSITSNDPETPVITLYFSGSGAIATYTLTAGSDGTGSGTFSLSTGESCSGPCSNSYAEGTSITITANPDQTSLFTGWTGCDSTVGSECTMTVNSARSIIATFVHAFPLNVTLSGGASGTVNLSTGATCSGNCNILIGDGALVTLTPLPGTSSFFSGWEGCDTVTGNLCTVNMSAARNIIATFGAVYPLTVSLSGTGTGYVNLSTGQTCSGTCSYPFNSGSTITLAASPEAGSTFNGWSGCDYINGSSCTVTIAATRQVTAIFSPTFPLALEVSGEGRGTVNFSTGQSCSSTCSHNFGSGSVVVLTAAPESSFSFGGWTGCDTVVGNACTVAISAARNVTATFTSSPLSLNLNFNGSGTGTVTFSTGEICTGTCSHPFGPGTEISLTPAPGSDSIFSGWSGCDSVGGNVCTVTINRVRQVTATFYRAYNLSLSVLGPGIVLLPTGGICSGTCNQTVIAGTTTTFTALPESSAVTEWNGCDSQTDNTCTVTINSQKSVSAGFGYLVKLGERVFTTIQSAYNDAGDGDRVLIRNREFPEILTCSRAITVTISGGYDREFSSIAGQTSVLSPLIIGKGSVVIENVVIR